jgi:hypothetical protein
MFGPVGEQEQSRHFKRGFLLHALILRLLGVGTIGPMPVLDGVDRSDFIKLIA